MLIPSCNNLTDETRYELSSNAYSTSSNLIYRCLEKNVYSTVNTIPVLNEAFRTNEHIINYFKHYEPQTTLSGKLRQTIFKGIDNLYGFLSLILNKPLHWVSVEPTYSYSKMLAINEIDKSVNQTLGIARDPFLGYMESPKLGNTLADVILNEVQKNYNASILSAISQ